MNKFFLVSTLACVFAVACAPVPTQPVTTRNSELTHGNVQLNLKVGETSQAQVLDVFGAPNITTIDGAGQEVWTWQRAATVAQSTSSLDYWTILIGGQSRNSSGLEQTQRMTTLIVKFDEKKIVSDFRSRSSEF